MQSNSKDQRAKIQVWALWCFCLYVLSDSDCFFVFPDSGRRWPQKKHSIKGQVNLRYIFMKQDHTRRKACLRSISLDFAIYRVYVSNVSGKQVNTKRLVRTNTTDPTYHTPSTNHHTSNKIIHLPYIASRHLSVTFAWTGLCQMSLCTTLRRSKHTTLSRLCGLHFQCSYMQPAVVYKHIYMCVMLSALAALFRAHSLPLL